jgi:biotin operon repressor
MDYQKTNENYYDIIDILTLMTQLKLKTEYSDIVQGFFKLVDYDMVTIYFNKDHKIPEHRLTKEFTEIINKLIYLNKDITELQIISYMYYVNMKHTIAKMKLKYFFTFVETAIKNIREYGLDIKFDKRHYLYHNQGDLNYIITEKERQQLQPKIQGWLKSNLTIIEINNVKDELYKNNLKITNKKISEILKCSVDTIKRHNKKKIINVDEMEIMFKEELLKLRELYKNVDDLYKFVEQDWN